MELSRRAFLKSSLAAAGVGALGLLSGCSTDQPSAQTTPLTQPDDASQTSSLDAPYAALDASAITEKTVDFVVVGAGPAGLCAAVRAAENGVSVAVIEKTGATGGCA